MPPLIVWALGVVGAVALARLIMRGRAAATPCSTRPRRHQPIMSR